VGLKGLNSRNYAIQMYSVPTSLKCVAVTHRDDLHCWLRATVEAAQDAVINIGQQSKC